MNFEPQFSGDRVAAPVVSDEMDEMVASRKRRQIVIAVAAGAVLLLAVLLWLAFVRSSAPPPSTESEVPRVSVIRVVPSAVTTRVSGTGSIAARRDMPVGVVGEGGRVTAVLVEPGTWVRAGQALATIERSVQSEQAASLAAQTEVARADLKLAQANLDRARALVGNGFISKADLDSRVATRDAAQARLKVAAAQLREARASMARLDVRAPAAGLVLTRAVEPGQVVSGGSGVLFRIAQGGEMEMRLAAAEGDLPKLRVGARADVTPLGTDRPFIGTVWQVSPVVDPQTRQGIARISLRYDPLLRPGAFAHADVIAGEQTGVMLPDTAVQSDQSGSFVYVVDQQNRVIRRRVRTGPLSDAGVPVIDGLRGGEQVVLTAGGFLNQGDKIYPIAVKSGR